MSDSKYAGVCIEIIEQTLDEVRVKFSKYYTIDENGKFVVDSDLTIAQLSPAITDLYSVVNDALIKIEAINNQQ